jgi:hypothetical protein
MPPRHTTHGRPPARAEPQTNQENPDPLVGDTVAQALNRIAGVMQNITRPKR